MNSKLLVIGICVLMGLSSCSSDSGYQGGTGCDDTDCADYPSKEAAQAAFDRDPECRNDLDHDNDGDACEDHFKSSPGNTGNDGCPKTSNCGCSNKRKAECESKCCKWVVGEGCKCR